MFRIHIFIEPFTSINTRRFICRDCTVERVLGGGQKELQDYLGFLSGGCSKDPLDLLRGAGVDMAKPEPVDTALRLLDNWSMSWTH